MTIKVIDRDTKREVAVDFGYHIVCDEENLGQVFYTADTKEEIEQDIANGVYSVVSDNGSPVSEEFDYEKAYNELVEVIEHE